MSSQARRVRWPPVRSRRASRAAAVCVAAGLALGLFGGHASHAALATAPAEICPLLPGAPMPDVPLRDASGQSTSLRKAHGGRPSVVIFYRGGW